MSGRYAYSFDRETFVGEFNSRTDALRAAQTKAAHLADPPSEVYVGVKVPGNSEAAGHASEVLRRMADRARAASDRADGYLQSVNEHEEADLDAALQATINNWLARLGHSPAFYQVTAISEHPMLTAGFPAGAAPDNR